MRELLKGLSYTKHLAFHPFDGFWDLKHERRGNMAAALVILIVTAVSSAMMPLLTGYIVSAYTDIESYSILFAILGTLIPFALWCIANWCLTTLMDGKGTIGDIFMASAYALAPLAVANILGMLVSQVLTIEEAAFFTMITTIGTIWTLMLLVFGTMTVHQYSFGKTMLTIALIIVGMAVILFIGLLLYTLCAEIINFIVSLYRELAFRT